MTICLKLAMDNNNTRVTRATRDGRHPTPKPLYSPQALAFGTIEAGALDVLLDAPTITSVMRPTTASAVRPTPASVEEDLITLRTPSPLTLGGREDSSALPSLTMSNVDAGVHDEVSAPGKDGGWTPVTRKTSRSHRERSNSDRSNHTNNDNVSAPDNTTFEPENGSETTMDQATNELSTEELDTLIRRQQNIVEQCLALKAQREASENAQDETEVNVIMDAPSAKVQDLVSSRRQAMVEEVEDEEDLISFNVIPSTAKGKGPDPGNWGGISAFQNFSEREMNVQRNTLMVHEEAKRMKAEEQLVSHRDVYA
ncbi:hypothetical protein DFH07DRAFT_767399 [Mycena maculata]|uniref:Uncharacterized protein n=1 Tax=Mycena maculata TaxID=230809 RepID=A0AAD7NTH3_9AGAR|nr:hypothetical protein DFH07DRAFT_767399 [Mycena maculata]